MAESVIDVKAEPSPADFNLADLTPEQRQTWRGMDGGKPPEEKKPEPAASEKQPSDAETVETEEAETESVPETDKQESQPRGAEKRIRELNAKLKAATAELEKLKTKPTETKAEPSPAKAEEVKRPVRPKMDDYDGSKGKTLEDYDSAMDKYQEDLAEYKAEVKIQQLKAEQAQESALQQTANEVKEARAKYKDFDTVAAPLVESLTDKSIHPAVINVLNGLKNVSDVIYAIGGDQEGSQRLIKAAKQNPADAIRQLGVWEYITSQALKPETKKVETPEPVTKVSKPVTEVGGRSTSTEDPAVAAARAGDIRGTFREWNRKAAEGRF